MLETPSDTMEYFDANDTGLVFDPIFSEFILAKCGPKPPDDASNYKQKLEKEKASNKLSKGGEYALSLIIEKIDVYFACSWGAISKKIEKRQKISMTIDVSRWGATDPGYFGDYLPLSDD